MARMFAREHNPFAECLMTHQAFELPMTDRQINQLHIAARREHVLQQL